MSNNALQISMIHEYSVCPLTMSWPVCISYMGPNIQPRLSTSSIDISQFHMTPALAASPDGSRCLYGSENLKVQSSLTYTVTLTTAMLLCI